MLREVLQERGKALAAALAFVLWSGLALACFLLPRYDWQVIVPPLVGAALLFLWPWSRVYFKSFLLVIFGVYGGLFFLEVGLRLRLFGVDAITHPSKYEPYSVLLESGAVTPSSDTTLLFGLTPNFEGQSMGQLLRVNSQGFRGPETLLQKAPGSLRLMSFGTSITMGAGVAESDTYTAKLGSLLQEKRSGPIEAINAGVGAYSMLQSFYLASITAPKFRPDVVIVEISPGGLYETGEPSGVQIGKSVPLPISTIERYSFAASALFPPANLRLKLQRFLPAPPKAPAASSPVASSAPTTLFIESQIRALTKQGQREGFSVIVFVVRPMSGFSLKDPELSARQQLAKAAKECGAYLVDSYSLFGRGELPDDFLVFPGDLHPNARAHARFAEALLPVLEVSLQKNSPRRF